MNIKQHTLIVLAIFFVSFGFHLGYLKLLGNTLTSKININTVTVTGYAKSQEQNQIATFTAGVNVRNADKETAVNEVNEKMDKLLKDIKEFGIEKKDIKTERVSVYEDYDYYYPGGKRELRDKYWQASNNISIILRNTEGASDLADLLNLSGATNVYGPNFSIDDTTEAQARLLELAVVNAKEKAQGVADAANKKLGDVVNVTEGSGISPKLSPYLYEATADRAVGSGAPIETGSTTLTKTVTVTFKLR